MDKIWFLWHGKLTNPGKGAWSSTQHLELEGRPCIELLRDISRELSSDGMFTSEEKKQRAKLLLKMSQLYSHIGYQSDAMECLRQASALAAGLPSEEKRLNGLLDNPSSVWEKPALLPQSDQHRLPAMAPK